MKKTTLIVTLWVMASLYMGAYAQGNGDRLAAFRHRLASGIQVTADGRAVRAVLLDIPGKGNRAALLKRQLSEGGGESFIGKFSDDLSSSVYLNFTDSNLNGFAVSERENVAYRYSVLNGRVVVKEISRHELLCLGYGQNHTPFLRYPMDPSQLPSGPIDKLQSLPSAEAIAYLDFDGEVVSGTAWNDGATINAEPTTLSENQIREVFALMSEDYRPFNINITTDRSLYDAAPKTKRMMCIFTPTNEVAPGGGGVAYLNSFTWDDDTPCWVFLRDAKGAGVAGAHELGHTFGLEHDGRTSPKEEYYQGHGDWAPLMGYGSRKSIVQWSKGEYENANQKQDDLQIIATMNGFDYREDDFGSTPGSAALLNVGSDGTVEVKGVIEKPSDVDVFVFESKGGRVKLDFIPYGDIHANLDISAKLLDESGAEIAVSNPDDLSAAIDKDVTAGRYYVTVDGVGYADPLTTGYTDYGSLGAYTISGTITSGGDDGQTTKVTLNLKLDRYPEETSWKLKDKSGKPVGSGGNYDTRGELITKTFDLLKGCYDFEIKDTYGDGICCSEGDGSYELVANGKVLASGGAFQSVETKEICVGGAILSKAAATRARGGWAVDNSGIVLYPNPVSERLHIRVKAMEKARFSISTTTGLELMHGKIGQKAQISVDVLKSGTYILKVYNKDEIKVCRFLKH